MSNSIPSLQGGELIGGELRYGPFGLFCSNGRKHIFQHLWKNSGTCMDIGPCEGESCPQDS